MFFDEDDYTIKGKAQLKQNHFKAQKILVSSFLNIMLLCVEIFFFRFHAQLRRTRRAWPKQ